MENNELNGNGNQPPADVIRFASLDTGDEVLAYPSPTAEGYVALALTHQMDGELEVLMDPKTAEELALALARAADEARRTAEAKD